jgi:chromate transporter
MTESAAPGADSRVPLTTVAREWTRIGLTGFGGPPAHVALLRALVVDRRAWMDEREFEDANAACGLLPGPASTQLAIFCAYRIAGASGAIIGGLGFVVPAIVLILALSELFLAGSPPPWVLGAGGGAGAAVVAVAVHAAWGLLRPSLARARAERARTARWTVYLAAGIAAAIWIGPYLVLALLACGAVELSVTEPGRTRPRGTPLVGFPFGSALHGAGLGSLAWTALKVGALSFGGGFVIVPLMRADAVHTYHWMTNAQFLNAVALGQVTPGPVVATVCAVGFAAHGLGGGLLAGAVAFLPSFSFILLGGGRFERLRGNVRARAFLDGAGPAAIGAILGAAVVLGTTLSQTWQFGLAGLGAVILFGLRRGVVVALICAGAIGAVIALAGGPLPS